MSDHPTDPVAVPGAGDPVLGLIVENTQALVSMSGTLDAHTRNLRRHAKTLDKSNEILERLAKAEEDAVELSTQRWSDIRTGAAALWANFFVSSALVTCLALLSLGLTLWILQQLGIDMNQIAPFLPGAEALPDVPAVTEIPS